MCDSQEWGFLEMNWNKQHILAAIPEELPYIEPFGYDAYFYLSYALLLYILG